MALIRQSYIADRYICVAGYVKQGESVDDAAKREVEEETGLTAARIQYVNDYYYEKSDTLMFGFCMSCAKSGFPLFFRGRQRQMVYDGRNGRVVEAGKCRQRFV